jgi:hypothetical protein
MSPTQRHLNGRAVWYTSNHAKDYDAWVSGCENRLWPQEPWPLSHRSRERRGRRRPTVSPPGDAVLAAGGDHARLIGPARGCFIESPPGLPAPVKFHPGH